MPESRGINIFRSDDTSILLRVILLDATQAKVISGTTSVRLFHVVPATGVLEGYDFADDTFKAAPGTPTSTAPAHQAVDGYNTGVWTYRHAVLTDFDVGDKYFWEVNHASLPAPIPIEFQYGDLEGDEETQLPDAIYEEAAIDHDNAGTFGNVIQNPPTVGLTGGDLVNIGDTIAQKVISTGDPAGSIGQRLSAVDDLTEAGGAGDLASIKSGVGAASIPHISVSLRGTSLRIECWSERGGLVELSPWTTAQVQIYDEANTLIENIGTVSFGSINARGFFGHTKVGHGLLAGRLYQVVATLTDGAVLSAVGTKSLKVLQV
jgi:hypothetical protein